MEIRVKITPNIKKESVERLPDGRYHVSVNADRKAGAANARMLQLLEKHFGLQDGCAALVSGHTSSTKTVRIKE